MNNYNSLNLKDNPFKDLTPSIWSEGANLKWAGMKTLKEKINKVYNRTINTNQRQVILNWGPYGGGKTFSAYYFLNEFKSKTSIEQIYLRVPKEGKNSSKEFFITIIDFITYEKIQQRIKSLVTEVGENKLFEYLNNKIRNSVFARAIIKIADEDEEISSLMQRYIYNGLTNSELKTLNIPRNIFSKNDIVKFLAGLLLCFIINDTPKRGKTIIWLDEMEDLVYFSQKDYTSFSQLLRDLIDTINENFTIFINFTLAEPEESTVELLLGGALWSRINNKIRFKEFTTDHAIEYINDLIKMYQIDAKDLKPFNKEGIDFILANLPKQLTPREINRYFGEVIEYAVSNKKNQIDIDLIKECLNNLNDE